MGRVFVAALVGAVLMFVWGFVSHMVLQLCNAQAFSNTSTLTEVLKNSHAESGMYVIPAMPADPMDSDAPDTKKFIEDHEAGPIAFVVYRAEGAEFMSAMTFLKGFLVMLASCFFVAFLVSRAKLASMGARLAFVVSFGVVIALYTDGSNWAWMYYPFGWTISAMIDHVAAWAAAGLGIALILKPKVTVH